MPNPITSPFYTDAWPITPSDTQPIQGGPNTEAGTPVKATRGFLCTVSGNLVMRTAEGRGRSVQTMPVIANTIYPIGLSYVYTTSTATVWGLL